MQLGQFTSPQSLPIESKSALWSPPMVAPAVIFTISAAELVVGMKKTEFSMSATSSASVPRRIFVVGILIEAALCAAVNVLTTRAAKNIDHSNREWKLLAAASFVDFTALFFEGFFASLFLSYRIEYGLTPTIKLRVLEAILIFGMVLLESPLDALYYKTEKPSTLIFENKSGKRMVAAVLSLSIVAVVLAWMFLLRYSSDKVSGREETLAIVDLLCATGLPLFLFSTLAVLVSLSGNNTVILGMLLIIAPPSTSLTLAISKAFLLNQHNKSLADDQRNSSHPWFVRIRTKYSYLFKVAFI